MSLVRGRREALSLKDVTQVATTSPTRNLDSLHTKRAVNVPVNSSWDSIEEGRPATAGFELCVGFVQWRVAACTGVNAI